MYEVRLLDNNLEDIYYNFPNLPIRIEKGSLKDYPNMSYVNHWHRDLEFLVPLKGDLSYSINGNNYFLKQGQAIFVNSEQMHYGYSTNGSDCTFICILIPIEFFLSINYLKKDFIYSIINDKTHPLFIFDSSILWQKKFINTLLKLYNLYSKKENGFELDTICCIFEIYSALYSNVKNEISHHKNLFHKDINILHNMTGYIQKNYQNKLSLNDIAISGNVCRSRCCSIFKSILGKSPFEYLTEYRLERSIDMLKTSNYSITEIAIQCGFNSSSYFTETFRKTFNYPPSKFKKSHFLNKKI